MIKVFWLEGTELERHSLRRYAASLHDLETDRHVGYRGGACPIALARGAAPEYAYHDVSIPIGDHPQKDPRWEGFREEKLPRDDPRWPTHCACGYEFHPDDTWQHNGDRLYIAKQGPHAGQLFTLRDAPIGAMWDASWYRREECAPENNEHVGPDGLCLAVKTPGGDWCVDAECSNCTRTQWAPVPPPPGREGQTGWRQFTRTHYCWVRHGDPRTGNVHVDKGGETCAAGAGSIAIGSYHGFLHNGYLT